MTRFQTDARMVEGWMDSCPDLGLTQLATVQLAHQNASANQCNDQHLDVDPEMEHVAGIIKSYRTSPTRAWAAFPCKSKTWWHTSTASLTTYSKFDRHAWHKKAEGTNVAELSAVKAAADRPLKMCQSKLRRKAKEKGQEQFCSSVPENFLVNEERQEPPT